jgi:elongation factor 1-beta
MPKLLVHRSVRWAVGTVAVTFRIMPADSETDLEEIKARVRKTLAGSVREMKEQPVAFGLNAIVAIAVVKDTEGGSENLEQSLAAIPGVGSVETVDVTLL